MILTLQESKVQKEGVAEMKESKVRLGCDFDAQRYIFALVRFLPLIQQMNSRRVWTKDQDKVIAELVQEHGTKNWASIASLLGKRLKEKPRSGKQCRQRWHNHLDPGIEKRGWSKNQEERMFELHKIHGNKWTVIAEQLPGRTDNAIKNYFYSTIRRSLRRMGKFVGSKNSTEQMKRIKPSTLSKIFAAGSELSAPEGLKPQEAKLITYIKENCESVRYEIIQFTNYKPRRNDKAPEAEKERFQQAIAKMVHINEVYERIKGEEKKRRYQEEMFQKDYNKLMLSSDSDEPSDEEVSDSAQPQSTFPLVLRKNGRRQAKVAEKQAREEMQQQAENVGKADSTPTHLLPTVIIKSQHNLELQSPQQGPEFENPDFLIELKDDFTAQASNHFASAMRSPGYYFNTPTINPFSFFQSPSTPKNIQTCFGSLQSLGVLQNSAIDEFQISIQREIECNLSGEQRKMASSISTIGSPGSAFRFYGP